MRIKLTNSQEDVDWIMSVLVDATEEEVTELLNYRFSAPDSPIYHDIERVGNMFVLSSNTRGDNSRFTSIAGEIDVDLIVEYLNSLLEDPESFDIDTHQLMFAEPVELPIYTKVSDTEYELTGGILSRSVEGA